MPSDTLFKEWEKRIEKENKNTSNKLQKLISWDYHMIRNVENMRFGVFLAAVCVYLGGFWCSQGPSKILTWW